MPIPRDEVIKLKKIHNVQTFIETGTYLGATTLWAASIFERVITIEADPYLWNAAAVKFSSIVNIDVLLGKSSDILPAVCKILVSPVIFWIDSHYSGNGTFGRHSDYPLIQELTAIFESQIEAHLFIDDMNLMDGKLNKQLKGDIWPGADDVMGFLKAAGYDVRQAGNVLCATKDSRQSQDGPGRPRDALGGPLKTEMAGGFCTPVTSLAQAGTQMPQERLNA